MLSRREFFAGFGLGITCVGTQAHAHGAKDSVRPEHFASGPDYGPAISAALATQKTVRLKNRVYEIETQIVVPENWRGELIGEGSGIRGSEGSSIRAIAPMDAMLVADGGDSTKGRPRISRVAFNGAGLANRGLQLRLYSLDISGVGIWNCVSEGIYSEHCYYSVFQNIWSMNNGVGYHFGDQSNAIECIAVRASANATWGVTTSGIHQQLSFIGGGSTFNGTGGFRVGASDCRNLTIERCRFEGNGKLTPGPADIWIEVGAGVHEHSKSTRVANCIMFSDRLPLAVKLDGGHGADIIGNRFTQYTAVKPVQIGPPAKYTQCRGNLFGDREQGLVVEDLAAVNETSII